MNCSKCGKENKEDSRFCKYCGYTIETLCPKCGKDMGKDDRFCMNCGTKMIVSNKHVKIDESTPIKKKKWMIVVIISTIMVLILVVLVMTLRNGNNNISSSGEISNFFQHFKKFPSAEEPPVPEQPIKEESSATPLVGSAPSASVTEQSSPAANINNDGIESTIKNYYQAVQDKRVDDAINMYSSARRPMIKVNTLQAIAADTEYYIIDSINVTSNDGAYAQTVVNLRHKKYKRYEENWEIYVSLIRENGVWQIVSTPGKKLW